ncbi:MAG: hyaluronoglucosaminidase [Chloroflexota bacterium]|nr:hyaluronoglucosaminidase [Chloroflexota bacterium]
MSGAAASPFALRGVIEGFYGNPYTQEQRLELVDFLAAHGMNTFVYGPKDDPLVRARWRDPYDGGALHRLAELVNRCRARDVQLMYCVSPGLSMRYSDPDDMDALVAKLASVADLGVDAFGLLLDDIPMELQHAEDRVAFSDLAEAHADVIRTLASRLGPDRHLAVCPTVYWGRGDETFIARLGAAIPGDVDLFWTGRAICSPTLDLDDARRFELATGRAPLYWDNYPVNDVAMTFELHIGPYLGRDPRLAEASRGIIANPMELFEASKIPLATIADYLRDPAAYDAEACWAAAIREVAGQADAGAFALFADNVRSSCLSAGDAPVVGTALEAFAFRLDRGEGRAAAADLAALADRLVAAAHHLLHGPVENTALVDDCRPWIEAFELGAQAIRRIAGLAAEDRLATEARTELIPYLARLRRARVRVFGDALDMTLADLTGTHVRPGRMLELERGGDSA